MLPQTEPFVPDVQPRAKEEAIPEEPASSETTQPSAITQANRPDITTPSGNESQAPDNRPESPISADSKETPSDSQPLDTAKQPAESNPSQAPPSPTVSISINC